MTLLILIKIFSIANNIKFVFYESFHKIKLTLNNKKA